MRVVGSEALRAGDADRLMSLLYELDVIADFDWPTWAGTRGAVLMEDPAPFANADLQDLRRLLIAHARNDRFNDGTGIVSSLPDSST